MIGQRFGRLVVEEFSRLRTTVFTDSTRGVRNLHQRIYWCRCDCGKRKEVPKRALGRETNSCGCLRLENNRTRGGEGWVTRLVKDYRGNARRRGRSWELTWDQVRSLVTSNCHYCGAVPPARDKDCWKGVRYNSIDRVDNSLDYVADNVVAACETCNYAKREMSREDFLEWARRVVVHQTQKGR